MASLAKTKLLSTGNEDLDLYLTGVFLVFIALLLIDIVLLFRVGYRDAKRSQSRGFVLRKRAIVLFVVLAVLSLLMVNAIKFEYQKLKSATWKDLQPRFDHLTTYFDTKKAFLAARLKTPVLVQPHPPDEQFQLLRENSRNAKQKIYNYLSDGRGLTKKIRDDTEKLLRIFNQWKTRDNVWDNFKMLLANMQRFWWTQQWLTAYASFAMFVAIECHHREIRPTAVVSFTALSYIFGLSGMQCLFYGLLLLKPKIPRQSAWMPHPKDMLIGYGIESVAILSLYWGLRELYFKNYIADFNTAQVMVILMPMLFQGAISLWPQTYMVRNENARTAKRSWARNYFYMSVHMAGAIHFYNTVEACRHVGFDAERWSLRMPWMKAKPRPMTTLAGTPGALLKALGDHEYISAIGVDVLFSAVALCCWAVVSNLDARSMIKCGIWPWLDDTQDALGGAAHRVRDAAGDAIATATATARRGSEELKRTASRLRYGLGLDGEGESEDVQDELSLTQLTAGRRGRPPQDDIGGLQARSQGSTRSQSRPRTSGSPVKRLSRRGSKIRDGPNSEDDEEERGIFNSTAQAMAGPAEAAAVAWGLFALGGLGMASTAVYGAGELE